jgi:enamine deaminase RidA (YjgF/YER057c/UK114 family)
MNNLTQQPIPQGRYVPAVRHADLIYTSGMTPRIDGDLQYVGKVGVDDSLEQHRAAVGLAATNALIAIESLLSDGEAVGMVLQLNVFINAEAGFTSHAALANFASDQIADRWGESCIGSRAAIGVATLPGDATVEITMVAAVQS